MTKISRLDVECALPQVTRAKLRPAEMDAILEIAFLAIIADGMVAEEEADAFVRVMLRMYGPEAEPARVRAIMSGFAERLDRGQTCSAARCDRVAEVAPILTRKVAREQAYKLAYVMAMSDLRTNDAEFAFDQALRRALRLEPDRAEELADEAMTASLGLHPRDATGAPVCAGDSKPKPTRRRAVPPRRQRR